MVMKKRFLKTLKNITEGTNNNFTFGNY